MSPCKKAATCQPHSKIRRGEGLGYGEGELTSTQCQLLLWLFGQKILSPTRQISLSILRTKRWQSGTSSGSRFPAETHRARFMPRSHGSPAIFRGKEF